GVPCSDVVEFSIHGQHTDRSRTLHHTKIHALLWYALVCGTGLVRMAEMGRTFPRGFCGTSVLAPELCKKVLGPPGKGTGVPEVVSRLQKALSRGNIRF